MPKEPCASRHLPQLSRQDQKYSLGAVPSRVVAHELSNIFLKLLNSFGKTNARMLSGTKLSPAGISDRLQWLKPLILKLSTFARDFCPAQVYPESPR